MDETKSAWFKWISDHAKYVFWGVWGAGVGAFGMVVTKAVDMTGITAPIYLAVLTVMMGGALGLISSRAMDRLADDRKRRRKILTARANMRYCKEAANLLDKAMKSARAARERAEREDILDESVAEVGSAAIRLLGAVATTPDLDDAVNTEIDLLQVVKIVGIYSYWQNIFGVIGGMDEIRKDLKRATSFLMNTDPEHTASTLEAADRHFAAQVADR